MKKRPLFLTCFCIAALLSLFLTFYQKRVKCIRKEGFITKIIQTGFEKEALKTDALAQFLGLSIDAPLPAASLNEKSLQKTLLSVPFIKEAHVKQRGKNALFVDYSVRKPFIWLLDGKNLAMDKERFIFPLSPFFTPKKMPKLYLGLDTLTGIWNHPMTLPKVELAFKILDVFHSAHFWIKQIDVSSEREVILTLDLADRLHYLRLTPSNFEKELSHYQNVASLLNCNQDCVIDLRVPHLAFIKKGEDFNTKDF